MESGSGVGLGSYLGECLAGDGRVSSHECALEEVIRDDAASNFASCFEAFGRPLTEEGLVIAKLLSRYPLSSFSADFLVL